MADIEGFITTHSGPARACTACATMDDVVITAADISLLLNTLNPALIGGVFYLAALFSGVQQIFRIA